MTNFRIITLLIIAFSFLGFSHSNSKNDLAIDKPNIIFILADDLSFRDLSCYGQQHFTTPNLDKLARNGIRFTQAYSAAPECAPSRGCLLTGLHTGHGPIRVNASARGQEFIKHENITVAEILKEAGYNCGFVGKWGVGLPGSEGVPYKQGFDYSFGFYDQGRAHTYFPYFLWENDKRIEYPGNIGFDMKKRYGISSSKCAPENLNTYDKTGNLFIQELAVQNNAVYSEGEIEKAAFKFIHENKNDPFFLYFATQLPHGPVIIDNLGEMNGRDDIPQVQREWAAMVQRIDIFTGKLIELLKELNEYENTIIFFASDNGYSMCGYTGAGNAPHWPNDPYLENKGPFTGGKFSALEGGIRIPFFVSWPSKLNPSTVNTPVWLPDFYATAAELAGINLKHKIDGQSLIPLLSGNPKKFQENRFLYFSKQNEQAVRMGSWKAFRKKPGDSIRLYLVEEDTYGERDLSLVFPEVVKKMENIMDIEHSPHEWYWNPGETREEFNAKISKAEETNNIFPKYTANQIHSFPEE